MPAIWSNDDNLASSDVASIDWSDSLTMILRALCDLTGFGFAAVARVTETSWKACAVLDRVGFGLKAGGELDVSTTLCNEIRSSLAPIIIKKASEDPVYSTHPTPLLYGFESYVAFPITRMDGTYFGTVCALDPRPTHKPAEELLRIVQLFAELIGKQLNIEEQYAALQEGEQRLRRALDVGQLGNWEFDIVSHAFVASDAFAHICGLQHGHQVSSFDAHLATIHPADRRAQADAMASASKVGGELDIEYRHHWPDGSVHWLRMTGHTIHGNDGSPLRMIGLALDVTDRRAAEEALVHAAHLAHHDALTGLANRRLFDSRLHEALGQASIANQVALLLIDLDQFKSINDALGHDAGDRLLRQVARNLCGCVRPSDTVARYGGDEFAAVITGIKDAADLDTLAIRMIQALTLPHSINGITVQIGGSIGIAVASTPSTARLQLQRNADKALYRAKASGRGGYRFFDAAMDAQAQARDVLKRSMPAALKNTELRLVYQPQVDLVSGRVVGFEALMRWQHPIRGLVAPGEFIALAEETGWMTRFGAWALLDACAEAMKWPSDVGVSVNLSAVQFTAGDLVADVKAALAASGIRPGRLELEITETLLLQNTDYTMSTLQQLRSIGIRVAMDDFGTGYSSLAYLRRFPFDRIKIDRSLITGLPDEDGGDTILRAIIGLGRNLGIAVIAEGVETTAQRTLLQGIGCVQAQGFLFSPPVAPGDVAALQGTTWL